MIYVALLRGINVGGKARVEMSRLKAVFENLGYTNVRTYINSGNVIFETSEAEQTLANTFEQAIEQTFGFRVPVVIRTAENICELAQQLPASWKNDQDTKTDVMFLWPSIDTADILDRVIIKPDIDQVMRLPGALVWHVSRANVNKGGMLKLVGTDTYKQMTVRNCNTLLKLAELVQAIS
jgi:uncharacterized protein (DUF1697 family)